MTQAAAPGPAGDRSADGLGHRAKIGLLVPATNTIAQPESEKMAPAGVTNHVARMKPSTRGTNVGDMDAYRQSLARDAGHIVEAIESVMHCEPDMVVLGHSIDTFRGGVRGAAALQRELETAASGVPVTLPSHAFIAALQVLGIHPGASISVLSPYWPPGDEQVHGFFTDAGYQVQEILGLKCPGALAIAATPVSQVVAGLKHLAAGKPQIILQPGTNLPTALLAGGASAWLDVPVLSCNTATYWHALRSLGIYDRMENYGVLFARH